MLVFALESPISDSARTAVAAGIEEVEHYTRTGAVQEMNDEFDDAYDSYKSAVKQVETEFDEFHPSLVAPLTGLGRVYIKLGDNDAAEASFRRAQHIIHRNDGVYSEQQLEVIDELTTLHLIRREPLEADRQQRMALLISEHVLEEESTALLPALHKLGKWFTETGQYHRARRTHKRALKISDRESGAASIETLRLMARTKTLQGVCCAYKILTQVVEKLQADNNTSTNELASAQADLADAYLNSRKVERAHATYARAWATLGDKEGQEFFDKPQQLALMRPLDHAASNTKQYKVPNLASFNRGIKLSREEQLVADYQPPQQFLVPQYENVYQVQIIDTFQRKEVNDEKTRKVIGHPFQFLTKQLLFILPMRMQKASELAELSVDLDFTVTEKGAIRDIEASGEGTPNRLIKLLKRVLARSRFRPRLVDAKPVSTQHVTLTQTFKTAY